MMPSIDPTPIDPAHIQQWRQAIRTTTHAHYHYHMGRALLRMNSPQAASQHLRQALAQEPQHARARTALIILARETGQEDQANALLTEGEAIDPGFTLRADVERCEEVQSADEAQSMLGQLLAPSYAQVTSWVLASNLLRLAEILTQAGRLSPAQTAYRAVLAAEPDNEKAHAGLCLNLLRNRDVEGLGTHLDSAAAAGIENASLAFARGQYLVLRHEYALADDAFAKAYALGHPQPGQIRLFQARIRLAWGAADQAAAMIPSLGADVNGQAYGLLARLRMGDDPAALADEANALIGGQEISRIVAAFVLAALGRRAEGLAGLDPLLAGTHSYMTPLAAAILRDAGGEEEKARSLLRQALDQRGVFFDFFLDGLPGGRECLQRLGTENR